MRDYIDRLRQRKTLNTDLYIVKKR